MPAFSKEGCAKWCCWRGLNSRPHPYQGCALPLSYSSVPAGRGRIAAGQARPMAARLAAVKVRGLTKPRFRENDGGGSKPPSPANLERERRLAEALRANLRKRKRSEEQPSELQSLMRTTYAV